MQVSSSDIKLVCKIKTKTDNKAKVDTVTGRKSSCGHLLLNTKVKQRIRGLDFFFSHVSDLLHWKGQSNLCCYSHVSV